MHKRDINEDLKQYKIRLFENKIVYGLSNNDIADLLNAESGETLSETTYRKWYKPYLEGYTDALKKNKTLDSKISKLDSVVDNNQLDDINEQTLALKKEVIKLRDQRNDLNKKIKDVARFEELKNIVVESLLNIEPYELKQCKSVNNSEYDLLIPLDDIHYGVEIKNKWNEYNSSIAKDRFELYLNEIVEIQKVHKAKRAYVCSNGDLISGNIHIPIAIANRENLIEQVKGVAELISWFIANLTLYFDEVIFTCVSGNHSRLSKKDEALKGERLDDLIPWYLKARLINHNNIFILDEKQDSTFNVVNIMGKNYLNVHGDYDNSHKVESLIKAIGEDIYAVHMGHMHHIKYESHGKYKNIMSGSFVGIDDYCIEHRIFGVAEQAVCVCGEEGIKCIYDISLQ